jgi:hypothetical protein
MNFISHSWKFLSYFSFLRLLLSHNFFSIKKSFVKFPLPGNLTYSCLMSMHELWNHSNLFLIVIMWLFKYIIMCMPQEFNIVHVGRHTKWNEKKSIKVSLTKPHLFLCELQCILINNNNNYGCTILFNRLWGNSQIKIKIKKNLPNHNNRFLYMDLLL